MVECWLPYGNTEIYITVNIRDLLGVAEPIHQEPTSTPREIMLKALSETRSNKKLQDIVVPDCSVTISVEGTTTPNIATQVLSVLVEQLVNLIVPKDKITIILANGQREKSIQDLIQAIKETDDLKGINILEHVKSSESLISIGKTNKGTPVTIEKAYHEAKVKIGIGEVHVDAYTGFTGAHTSIIPGIAAPTTIEANRKLFFKGDIKPGIIEFNSIKEDAFEVVKQAGLDMAINLVVNPQGKLLTAYAGDFEETFGQAIYSLGSSYQIETSLGADIIIVSAGGSKFDYDLYSATWALQGASKVAKKGAAIILLAECLGGLGVDSYSNLANIDQRNEFERRFQLGAEALQFLKATSEKNEIWLVSSLPRLFVEPLGINMARTANEAYEKVCESRRSHRTVIIPYGCSTIPNISD